MMEARVDAVFATSSTTPEFMALTEGADGKLPMPRERGSATPRHPRHTRSSRGRHGALGDLTGGSTPKITVSSVPSPLLRVKDARRAAIGSCAPGCWPCDSRRLVVSDGLGRSSGAFVQMAPHGVEPEVTGDAGDRHPALVGARARPLDLPPSTPQRHGSVSPSGCPRSAAVIRRARRSDANRYRPRVRPLVHGRDRRLKLVGAGRVRARGRRR